MHVLHLMKEEPVRVLPTDSIDHAARLMKRIGCGILPVVDPRARAPQPIGVLTDRDIVLRCIAEGRDPQVMTVGECCSEPAICCDEDCRAEDAFHTMREHGIGRLPVIDAQGGLVGIVSMADIIARDPKEIWSQLPGAQHPIPRKAA